MTQDGPLLTLRFPATINTLAMISRTFFCRTLPCLVLGFGAFSAPADDSIDELARAKDTFEKEMGFSTRPIRDRYLSRLESMKRALGSRGDARAAAAVQDEIDRVSAMNPEPAGVVRFAGLWAIEFTNGDKRRYAISADGTVAFVEAGGKPQPSPARAKLTLKGNDFLLDWNNGAIERLKIAGKNLAIEHFNPKATYPAGQPFARGTGVIVAVR